MKTKKLTLNKTTVAQLNEKELNSAKGGIDPTVVISMCLVCPPWWTDFC